MSENWRAVALSTERADRAAAEQAVKALYSPLPGGEPEIVWCDSPLAAARLIAAEPDRFGASARTAVRDKPWESARAELVGRLGMAGFGAKWTAACAPLVALTTMLTREIGDAVVRASDGDAAVRVILTHAVQGQFDAGWLPVFEDEPGLAAGPALAAIADVARGAGWWWPFERAVVLTERPTELRLDEQGRLSRGDGPALAYPDGFGIDAWRGTVLEAGFAAKMHAPTPELIRAEENAELRRMLLENFTVERYVAESGAEPVQADETGKLWRIVMPGDEAVAMVEVVNSTPEPDGTRNVYWLRVPPDTRTAREGVAWTFGLTAEEYRPLAQT